MRAAPLGGNFECYSTDFVAVLLVIVLFLLFQDPKLILQLLYFAQFLVLRLDDTLFSTKSQTCAIDHQFHQYLQMHQSFKVIQLSQSTLD